MFKLESYITPLLLGYVDKYIKNLKSEDFQLSLWGGDAVFTNLDLRLDVLEHEFHLPFTFTNGHIHELRIHVPWTKLGSEPIVITIETIECVLMLKDESESDGGKAQKNHSDSLRKRHRKSETPEAPPGYVQGFINKILNNISIVCNNLILKYVEDDIVLSLNIKSAEMYNVNNNWERAFTELSAQNPVLRRVINMLDLTMCLDKRNSSGIIEVYQDPLLFRCSAWCRLYTAYGNPHSKLATTTRVSVFCEQLDFSITDQQLPMLFRLIQLCLALMSGEINFENKPIDSLSDREDKSREEESVLDSGQVGWSSWAWSYVPQILPILDEEWEEGNYQKSLANHIFQFRFLTERTSLVFKASETAMQSSKLSFRSIALARLYGTSLCLTLQGNRFVNSQLGVTAAEVTNLDTCICGGCKTQENDKVYFQSGVMPGDGHTYSFLTASLFDPLSSENCSNNSQDILVDWEKHLSYLTEAVMNERYPSFAFDFLYDLEIPPDWSDKMSDITASFLERSNFRERSLCRMVVGKACINVSSSFVHLINYIYNCGMDHDYAPYYSNQQINFGKYNNPTEDDILALLEFVPTRNYHILWHQPLIRIQMADHPCLATSNKDKQLRKQKSPKLLKEAFPKVPLLLSASLIEIQQSDAFYPQRMNAISSSMGEAVPAEFIQHCFSHTNVKIFNLELLLHAKPQLPIAIVPPFSLAAYRKSILFPQMWQNRVSFLFSELFFEVDQWLLQMSKSQAMYLGCLCMSWYQDAPFENNLVSTLLADIGNKSRALASFSLFNLNLHTVETQTSLAYHGTVRSIKIMLDNEGLRTTLFNAPEDTSDALDVSNINSVYNSVALEIDPLPFIDLTLQLPKDSLRITNNLLEPTIVVFKLQGFVLNFEPEILSWLEMSLDDIFVDAPCNEPTIHSLSSVASSHSNEMSSTYSLGRTMSANTLGGNANKKSPVEVSFSAGVIAWFHILKQATIQIEIINGCILCPTTTWLQNSEIYTNILGHWKQFIRSGQQISALIITTPKLKITSHGNGLVVEPDIPYKVEKPDDSVKFPWTLKFTDFNISTLGLNGNDMQYLLKPINASLTLAITDSISQLSFCIHLDLESLFFSITKDQVVVVTLVIDEALNCAHQTINTFSGLQLATKSNNLNSWLVLPTTYENKQVEEARKEIAVSPVSEYLTAVDVCQASAIKLTMWLQCTLPKLGISFFSNETDEVWLQLEAEEVTASLDIQDVFVKGKAKVTLFTINSFKKCSESGQWKPSPFEGVVLCGCDKLTRNMTIPSHLASNWHSYERLSSSQKTASFLSLTYTRVLNSSVEKFWAKKLKDLPLDSKSSSKENVSEALENKPKYISEFDVKLDQFDLVLWIPLLVSVTEILSPMKTLSNNCLLAFRPVTLPLKTSDNLSYSMNVQNLPLIYLQMGGMRCFFPSSTEESQSRLIDVCMVQIGKIVLVPQAENMLSRILINDSFYKTAEKAGTLGVPGSLVEDRQYQLDLTKISLTGASWKNIRETSKISQFAPLSSTPSLLILGQNPAAEWNKRGIAFTDGDEDQAVLLQPIVMAFDLRIVAAPAIICATSKNCTQDVIVCGHSLEINAVTDVDIYFSFQQLRLITDILKDNLIKGGSAFTTNVQTTSSGSQVNASGFAIKDSGIESEVVDLAFASVLTDSMLTESNVCDRHVPVEVLLTANIVGVMIFLHETDLTHKMKTMCQSKRKIHRRNKTNPNKATPQQLSPLQEDRLSNGKKKKTPRCNKKTSRPEVPSNESSPERIVAQNSALSRMRKKSATCTADSSEDGYEGSNDSSSSCPQKFQTEIDDKNTELKEFANRNFLKIHPFLYLVFSQPHTFISWRAESQKLQISCFDLSVKSGRHNYFIDVMGPVYCPLSSHFPIPWFETKPGDTNPKTGIPPSLITIVIKDFLIKPAEISLNMERPCLQHFSVNRWDQLNAVVSSAKTLFTADNEPNLTTNPPEDCVKIMFGFVKKISISTIQLVLILEGPPSLMEQQLIFSVNSFNTDSELIVDKYGKKWNADFKMRDFQLKINSISSHNRHIIGPLTMTLIYKQFWADWNEQDLGAPLIRVQLHCGPLYATIAPKQMIALKSFYNFWTNLSEIESNKAPQSSACNAKRRSSPNARKKSSHQIKTNDDIRNGSFKFVHDWDGYGQIPEPGEVVFGKDADEKLGTMTWRYPQPRVITKVDVYPVPLKPLDENEDQNERAPEEVHCVLQYWDDQKHNFVNYEHFKLVESCSQNLDLPFVALDTVHEVACTDIWRVTLKCDNPETEHLPVLPNVLAACMRVDSLFDSFYIANTIASLDIDMAQITFCNHFKTGQTPDSLFPFLLDDQMVQDQEFMTLNIDSGRLAYRKWFNKQVIDTNCSIGCELIDYRNLTLQPFADPVDFQGQILFTQHHKKRDVIEIELNIHPCYIRLGQSAIHTINMSIQTWNQILDNQYLKDKQIIPNYYVICNNTNENIRFGQVSTEESILLASNHLHAYSWRSHKFQQMIRVCLESMHWKWCEPFSIDSEGVKVRVMESKGQSLTLVLRIEKLNNVQKQVIITGQILVSSRLDFPLDVRLFNQKANSNNHSSDCRLPQSPSCIKPFSSLPAFLLHSSGNPVVNVQLRQQEVEAPWSENILLTRKNLGKQLIEVPGHKTLKIWCHVLTREILPYVTIYIVVLAPLYILRNHLSTPVLVHIEKPITESIIKEVIEIEGRGKDYQISSDIVLSQVTGNSSDENVRLHLQLAAGMDTSNPAIQLAEPKDLENSNGESGDDKNESAEDICFNWLPIEPYHWPYDDHDKESELKKLLKRNILLHYEPPSVSLNMSEVPNTVLNVSFYRPWANVNTMLVDIKPWALMVNRTETDLFLRDPDGHEWFLAKNSVITPPLLLSAFAIGLELDAQVYYSRDMRIDESLCDDEEPKYTQDLILKANKVYQITIWMPLLKRKCAILIDIDTREKVYIISLRPRVFISNCSLNSLNLVNYISAELSPISCKFNDPSMELLPNVDEASPLLLWDCDKPLDKCQTFNYCLRFSVKDEQNAFCKEIHISSLSQVSSFRRTVSICNGKGVSLPFVLTFHWKSDCLYIIIKNDSSPYLCLHNYTNHDLQYGQSLDNSSTVGQVNVLEETSGFSPPPNICTGEVAYYTFPLIDSSFPVMLNKLPALHLSKHKLGKPDIEKRTSDQNSYSWCPPIDVSEEVDHFVHIPDVGDVRVHKEKVGHTMHIFLESVNRVEVSAKEIRSRIGSSPCKPVRQTHQVKEIPKQNKESSAIESPCQKQAFHTELPKPYSNNKTSVIFVSVLANHICGILCDDVSEPQDYRELLRISIDRLCFLLRPTDSTSSRISSYSITKQALTLCIGSLQIDNQLAHGLDSNTDYEFNVLLVPENQKTVILSTLKEKSTLNYIAKCTETSFITVHLTLAQIDSKHTLGSSIVIDKLSAEVKPVALYLEDTLYYHMLQLLAKTEFSNFNSSLNLIAKGTKIPNTILALATSLSQPLPIIQLEMKPLIVLVSLHASLKLFLAIDHSPLSFKGFQNKYLFTSSYELGQRLTVHYLTGALLRAGWVVGSLDLLGNPAGLARALSSGVSDMVLLPYRGILQGPWAFLTGMSHGTVSFFKQISSGAVISVTNMASSISKNMDKLSLDKEHLKRQKLMRRKSVDGLTSGLVQGLSGFGVSLLGAVAGLIDQPLQAVISDNVVSSSGATFVLKAATGIVEGASKGLVGMVVKPIGGAAELISQTGQGLLHGVGWKIKPSPRYLPISSNLGARTNTNIKYSWKILRGALGSEALYFLDGTHITSSGHRASDVLVLTSQVLCVINKEEDKQEQTFSLTEIDCLSCPNDNSLIFITLKPNRESIMPEVDKETKDRVAEYVNKISSELGHAIVETNECQTSGYEAEVIWRDAYQFSVYPKLRDHFLTVFQIEQYKAMGKRYNV